VNPPVIVWDSSASLLVFVIQIRRQDHCLWLRLCFGASHAASVAALSSVTPGVGYGTPHEQPASNVEEGQAAICSRFAQIANALFNVCLYPVAPHLIHVASTLVALAIITSDKPKRPRCQ